jgi:Fe2+ transport system protein FeoA
MTFIERLKEHTCRKACPQEASRDNNLPVDVTRIDIGQKAKIVELQGSGRVMSKLKAMGFVCGVVVAKKSMSPMRGPIILEKGAMLVAVSRSLAQKIIVSPLQPSS